MNESFYVAVVTIAPVLLLGTVLAFRIPEGGGRVSRFFLRYSLMFAVLGIVGTAASLLAALGALMNQTDLPEPINILIWGALSWLTAINAIRILDPFISGLVVVGQRAKIDKLGAKKADMERQILEIETKTQRLWEYAAALEAQAGIGPRERRRLIRASKKTRLLTKDR